MWYLLLKQVVMEVNSEFIVEVMYNKIIFSI